jgi:hypothetical protein
MVLESPTIIISIKVKGYQKHEAHYYPTSFPQP